MLPVIQSLWIGKELSALERLVISSFLANGHEFHLYVYSPIAGIPNGTNIKDANAILKKKEIFTCNGSYALFADWFRWKLLNRVGGYWVDMDVICLKPFNFTDDIVFGLEDGRMPTNSVLKFPLGHTLTSLMIDRCEESYGVRDPLLKQIKNKLRRVLWGNRKDELSWGYAGGPIGFKVVLEACGLLEIGKPASIFNPVHYNNWQDIFLGNQDGNGIDLADAYGLHFWNERLRSSSLDKNGKYAEDSLIEVLKDRYHAGWINTNLTSTL